MVNLIRSRHTRKTIRKRLRSNAYRAFRSLNRAGVRNLPGYRRGPSYLGQALSAFSRAIQCQRRLARLAPRFFNSAVVDRDARDREERQRWRAIWEPILTKVYGPAPDSAPRADPLADRPPLPGPRTQRAVERELAGWNFWMAAGRLAMHRHKQRRPHALPSFSQLARLISIHFDFARLACGLDSRTPEPPPPPNLPNWEEDLARAYGPDSPNRNRDRNPNLQPECVVKP